MIRDMNNSRRTLGCGERKRSRHGANIPRRSLRQRGFTLLELMIVISIMMVLAAIAVPAYQRHVIQTREAVLRANVNLLNKLVQEYTLDKRQAPQSLDDLKTAGYLHELPKDPFTGASDWDVEQEDPTNAADPQQPGITRVHSHAPGTSLEGEPYANW